MTTTPQHKIGSGFDARSTADDVLHGFDLSGSTAIVTGGYSGLGLEATRALAAAGAHVIVPARRRAVAQEAVEGIDGVEVDDLDLSDLDSVRGFANRFLASGRDVGIVINNAGIMACPEASSATDRRTSWSSIHGFRPSVRTLIRLRASASRPVSNGCETSRVPTSLPGTWVHPIASSCATKGRSTSSRSTYTTTPPHLPPTAQVIHSAPEQVGRGEFRPSGHGGPGAYQVCTDTPPPPQAETGSVPGRGLVVRGYGEAGASALGDPLNVTQGLGHPGREEAELGGGHLAVGDHVGRVVE
ncbi:SDR family NAD(P)-dependent oxidoreductase [Streptomyces sp. NBC_00727]|uniref:SDR family NAD(P)-dependent oxidoreductase n=1 Tax=Streptomyces sp. NBC_00727 TaxID=2903675 RepID=UPI003867FCF5